MKYEYLRKRHSVEAKKDLQKFIDYLSVNPCIKWHFDNDCKWPYIKTPAETGWCGHVQNFFILVYVGLLNPLLIIVGLLVFIKKMVMVM